MSDPVIFQTEQVPPAVFQTVVQLGIQGARGLDGEPGAPSTVPGPKGDQGNPGASVNLQVSGGYIQWQHQGDTSWTNLIAVSSLVGATGATGSAGSPGASVNLQVSGGYIQWKHVGDAVWTNLIAVSSLVGAAGATGAAGSAGSNGVDGKSVNLQVSGGYIQWQHVGDSSWTNLIAVSSLVGPSGATGPAGSAGIAGSPGASVNLQVSGGYIQWQHVGDSSWTNLIAVSSLVGATGAAGPQGPAGNNGSDASVTSSNIATALGFAPIGDAPSDETQYARKNGTWVAVTSGGGASFNQSLNTTDAVAFASLTVAGEGAAIFGQSFNGIAGATNGGAGGASGSINLNGGNGANDGPYDFNANTGGNTANGGQAGTLNLGGGAGYCDGYNAHAGGNGGSILLTGAGGDAAAYNAGNGGSIIMTGAGGADAGSINTSGYSSDPGTWASGGSINTSGGGDVGGNINTSNGGGNINTSNGGGSIDTQAGHIELKGGYYGNATLSTDGATLFWPGSASVANGALTISSTGAIWDSGSGGLTTDGTNLYWNGNQIA